MIYESAESSWQLSQGDIFDECPIVYWIHNLAEESPLPEQAIVRALVLTQACDLAQTKTTRVLIAVVHRAQQLVDRGILPAKMIREQVRTHRVYGWYFLPAAEDVEESIVDWRDLHIVPRTLLEHLIAHGKRITRISTPYKEHLSQHFSNTYSRIALPEPYPSTPDV